LFRMLRPPFLMAAAVLAGTSGCGGNPTPATGGSPAPVTIEEVRSQKVREAAPVVAAADRQALASESTAFAMALYRQVEAANPNLVFSPVSISTALAMAWAGARSETETQMARALRFTLPQERLHPAMNEVTAALDTRGDGTQGADGKPFRLKIVNTTWVQKGFTMQPAFLDVLAASYGAGVHILDFMGATEVSRQAINRWVEQQTEDRIKNLLPEGVIVPDTQLVLTNAVYFNAAWKSPFPASETADGPFTRLDGSTATVPMMHNAARFRAATLPGLVAVALPYEDDRLSMLVVLPDAGKLAEVESALAMAGMPGMQGIQGLSGVTAALQETSVLLTMPRFRFETPIGLKEALSALGMPIAFTGNADFTGIDARGGLYLHAVLHKAFIAVAEKGTEAAAATAVVVRPTSVPQGLKVVLDRPFLFFVRDEPTGAILFMGRVSDPGR
jgi:serpin B